MHVELLKLPPFPPSFQTTVPVGVIGVLLVSETVTVNFFVFPIAIVVAGLGVTLVEVVCETELTVSDDAPELPTCEVSPEWVAVIVTVPAVEGAV